MNTRPFLAALLVSACGPLPVDGDLDPGPAVFEVSEVLDLGTECLNAGALKVQGDQAYVACGGDFSGNGSIARVTLPGRELAYAAVGGAPGVLATAPGRVVAGDMLDGRVFVLDEDLSIQHGAADPVVLCPSDFGAGIYQFISGITALGGELVASCFATDEVLRFGISPGAQGEDGVLNAVVTARVTAGDGAGALALWKGSDVVVLDGLAGTASLAHLGANPSVEVGKWSTAEAPNAVHVVGDRAWIVNSSSNTLQILDLATGTTVQEIFTGDGSGPWSVASLDAKTALVTLNLTHELAVVDVEAGEVVQRVAMPTGAQLHPLPGRTPFARPQGVAVTAAGEVLVSLTNLGEDFAPAGHGTLVVLSPAETP